MDENPSNQNLYSQPEDNIESIAANIFSRFGIDFAKVEQADGWTNAVWMTDTVVLRLSTNKENKSLLNEAKLSAFFPSEAGYPQVLETGTSAGYAWAMAKRLPGKSLGEVWGDLRCEERVTALKGLWTRAEDVHSVPIERIATTVPRRAWFNSTNSEEAEMSLAHLAKDGILTQEEVFVLQGALTHFWEVLPSAPRVLCHGDLTLDNALWHEGQVTALLDFEFAVLAPVQLDLNHLVKKAFGPNETDKYSHEAQQLRQAVKELALPILVKPGSKTLLIGYAILLELWLLEEWLAHPEGEGPLEQWDPLRRLRMLADGKGGYLAQLFPGRVLKLD